MDIGRDRALLSAPWDDGDVLVPAASRRGGGARYQGRTLLPDVDVRCETVARAITPRVGGVGPPTIAMLFSKLVDIAKRHA